MKRFSVGVSVPVAAMFGAVLLVSSVATAAPKPDGYGAWATDCGHKVHACEYTYTTKDGAKGTQTVVIHYADAERRGWAYYYNADQKPWARVALPGNPKYNAKQMYWQKLNATGDGYEDYPTKGFCPAPKDGKATIPALPLPPK